MITVLLSGHLNGLMNGPMNGLTNGLMTGLMDGFMNHIVKVRTENVLKRTTLFSAWSFLECAAIGNLLKVLMSSSPFKFKCKFIGNCKRHRRQKVQTGVQQFIVLK